MKTSIYKINSCYPCHALFIIIVIMLMFTGCGDSESNVLEGLSDSSNKEAKLEEARILTNERKYDEAIEVLETLNQDDLEVLRPLAGAYAGLTNYETIKLLDAVSIYQSAEDKGETTLRIIAYVMLGSKLDITREELEFALDNLTYSISLYEKYLSIDPETNGVITQLGFVSLTHFSYLLIDLISLYQEAIGHTGTIEFSEGGIKTLYDNDGFDFNVIPGTDEIIEEMGKDIERMVEAARVIAEIYIDKDKYREEIIGFLNKIDNGQGDDSTARDNILTESEIIYYLSNL